MRWIPALLLLAGCNQTSSPNILIIGDSISLGYTPFVQQEVPNVSHNGACSYFLDKTTGPTNAGSSKRAAACINIWLSQGNYQIVHFNTGMHDTRDCGNGPLVSLSDYLMNLQTILDAIRASGAKPIFATTTPVEYGVYCHSNSVIAEYNQAAIVMMQSQGVQIDDLYSYMLPVQSQYHLLHNIHFTKEGYEFLSDRVSYSISRIP